MSDDNDGWAVGALLGFIFGGPVGGLVGAVLGAAADEACQPTEGSQVGSGHRPASTSRPSSSHNGNSHGYQRQQPRCEEWVEQVPNLPTALDNAFATLKLHSGASLDTVKRRYHEMARRCHPDVYEGAGNDPRLRAEAQVKFIALREAYDLINQYLASRR